MSFTFEQYWDNPYNLAIIWCTHWDETLWLKVINRLKEKMVKNVTYVIANKMAQEKWVRYIDTDLNRSFTTESIWHNSWLLENKLAWELDAFLSRFSHIIDLHSTSFTVPWYFIIDSHQKLNLPTVNGTSLINRVYLIDWLEWALISRYRNAIAIEIWNNNNPLNIDIVTESILDIMRNLNRWTRLNKEVYTWSGEVLKRDISSLEKGLADFSFVRKWEVIWYDNNWTPILANNDTYLLWVNLEDENVLCHRVERVL